MPPALVSVAVKVILFKSTLPDQTSIPASNNKSSNIMLELFVMNKYFELVLLIEDPFPINVTVLLDMLIASSKT